MSRSKSSFIFSRMAAFAVAGLFAAGLVSCGGGGSTPLTDSMTEASARSHDESQNLAASSFTAAAFAASLTSAPANKAVISGIVTLSVRGSNLGNVELLPAQGYVPKLAGFAISADRTTATGALDTTKLADGPMVVRISAFNEPAGSATAKEIIVMPARTWTIQNGAKPDPSQFTAQIESAPDDGSAPSGVVTLSVTGSNMKNVELLPTEGYVPKYKKFTVSPDGTRATASLDTSKLPDGVMSARIVAFDAPAGQPANQILVMPVRTWNISNNAASGFTAQVAEAPADGATLSGPVRLIVTGTNLRNVELLPPNGYSPKYARFTIAADKKSAIVILDTRRLTNGMLPVRISAFNQPAGSATAKEIIAMPTRTWNIQNGVRTNSWIFTDIGPANSIAGINDMGEVAGTDFGYAFLYKNGGRQNLGTLGGQTSGAAAINNYGNIVGTSKTASGLTRAFLFQNGAMTDIGVPPDLPSDTPGVIRASGINDANTIVGRAGSVSPFIVFRYKNGIFTNLNAQLGGREYYFPHDLNNLGQFLLTFGIQGMNDSFLYSGGTLIDLAGGDTFYDAANGMNNLGEVVGETIPAPGANSTAYLYRNGQRTNLGSFLGAQYTSPMAINDKGQIVGHVIVNNLGRAFLYRNGNAIDLNGLKEVMNSGWTLRDAAAINNGGQIAGIGMDSNGQSRGFILTPVYASGP